MLADIPQSSPQKRWSLPPEEAQKRRDLRSERVFSIDPLGSQDIDDALSGTHMQIFFSRHSAGTS